MVDVQTENTNLVLTSAFGCDNVGQVVLARVKLESNSSVFNHYVDNGMLF